MLTFAAAQLPNAGVFNGSNWRATGNSMLQAPFISQALVYTTPKLTWGCWLRWQDAGNSERVVATQMTNDAVTNIWRFCESRVPLARVPALR